MFKLFLTLFCFVSNLSFAQENFEYLGVLKLNGNDKSLITYRLIFKELDGVISGYSITDLGGVHETKNYISGKYNSKTNEFYFKENGIAYTKSKYTDDMFCFVNFNSKLKLKNTPKIEGDFKGLYANNTKCIDGTLSLVNSKKIDKLLIRLNKKIEKSDKLEPNVKKKLNPINILDSLKRNNLLKNQNLTIFATKNELTFEIWDDQVEDGDVINLFQNENLILKQYKVMNKSKELKVQLNSKKTVFKIEAVNEGEIKLNTTTIQINDDGKKINLISILKANEKAYITIVKN